MDAGGHGLATGAAGARVAAEELFSHESLAIRTEEADVLLRDRERVAQLLLMHIVGLLLVRLAVLRELISARQVHRRSPSSRPGTART